MFSPPPKRRDWAYVPLSIPAHHQGVKHMAAEAGAGGSSVPPQQLEPAAADEGAWAHDRPPGGSTQATSAAQAPAAEGAPTAASGDRTPEGTPPRRKSFAEVRACQAPCPIEAGGRAVRCGTTDPPPLVHVPRARSLRLIGAQMSQPDHYCPGVHMGSQRD